MDDEENPGECTCCGYQTTALTLYKDQPTTIAGGGKLVTADFWFCELCASTPASNAHCYPGQYPDGTSMRTVCYVGNVLLQRLALILERRADSASGTHGD